MTTTKTTTETVTIVTRHGVSLRRSQEGSKVLWQAEGADPERCYWYSTARQAAAVSNCSDRMVLL